MGQERALLILEVSRKQDYIFSSKKLVENAARSAEIAFVTSNRFFETVAKELYSKDTNMVYSGGGHTVLQFEDGPDGPAENKAYAFAKRVTEAVLQQYNGLELFVKLQKYNPSMTPGENLKALSAALEKKKSIRQAGFRRLSFGVEQLDEISFEPKLIDSSSSDSHSQDKKDSDPPPEDKKDPVSPPEGWEYPREFEVLAGNQDNFIAVVHIDGNSMGKRVQSVYAKSGTDWNDCCVRLRRFSEGIESDFNDALRAMVEEVSRACPVRFPELPVRPVILAGDDVCFVTAGNIGLECARIFLEHLSTKTNCECEDPYSACAGVALVHKKFPFHRAYDLAEELCSNAKKFGAALDPECRVSAMDWHIEFGELRDSLAELREDYLTEDRNRMELRPVAVLWPQECKDPDVRTYQFVRTLCCSIQENSGEVARSKIKELRQAFRQGVTATRYFMHDKQIESLLWHAFESKFLSEDAKWESYKKLLLGDRIDGKRKIILEAFRDCDAAAQKDPKNRTKKNTGLRCLFFDAIEMEDHFTALPSLQPAE